jgi:hypothetical protein
VNRGLDEVGDFGHGDERRDYNVALTVWNKLLIHRIIPWSCVRMRQFTEADNNALSSKPELLGN